MSNEGAEPPRQRLRLPQDVGPPAGRDRRGVPALLPLAGTSPAAWEESHRAAVQAGDHEARVLACWGLVAYGRDADDVVAAMLACGDADLVEDAAGVLTWTGIPDTLAAEVQRLADDAGDTQVGDALWQALEASGL